MRLAMLVIVMGLWSETGEYFVIIIMLLYFIILCTHRYSHSGNALTAWQIIIVEHLLK